MRENKKKTDYIRHLQQGIIDQKHPLVWLVDSFTESVHLIDPYEVGFPFLYVNEKFTDMTGYGNEIIGNKKNFLEGAETDEEASRKMKEVIEFEESSTIEMVNYRKNGTLFWKEINLYPLYDDYNELLVYICVQHDITYKKTGGSNKEIQTFQSPYDIHSNLIVFITPDGILEKPKINSSSIEMINDKAGQYAADFIVEEDKEKYSRCFHNAMQGNVENAQIRVIHDNKNIVELDIIYIPFYSGKKINGIHIIYKNSTSHDKTNQFLIDAEKYNIARKLALSIADEVKLPLTSLRNFMQLASLDANIEPNYVEAMLSEIDRIELITTGLPFLLRPRIISFEKQNLRTSLEYICEVLYTSALAKDIEIHLAYHTKTEEIDGNKKGLQYVFLQVIKNAMEAMPLGGVISVEVTDNTNESVLIRMIDEGKGMKEEELEKVKQTFYTTKKEGLGLALTICNNIIKEHKGSLNLISKENKGTIVEIVLPTTLP